MVSIKPACGTEAVDFMETKGDGCDFRQCFLPCGRDYAILD